MQRSRLIVYELYTSDIPGIANSRIANFTDDTTVLSIRQTRNIHRNASKRMQPTCRRDKQVEKTNK